MSHAVPPAAPLSLHTTRAGSARRPARAGAVIAAAVAAGAGALIPPAALASALVGAPAAGRVVAGVWIFKALLVVHAAILWATLRVRLRDEPVEPLIALPAVATTSARLPREGLLIAGVLVVAAVLRGA